MYILTRKIVFRKTKNCKTIGLIQQYVQTTNKYVDYNYFILFLLNSGTAIRTSKLPKKKMMHSTGIDDIRCIDYMAIL